MVKRFKDVPYYTFSTWSDMTVVCPKCGKAGTVRFDKERKIAVFRCDACFAEKEAFSCGDCGFEVTAQCTSTGKYFKTLVSEDKVHGQKLRVKCNFCDEFVIGDVSDNRSSHLVYADIRRGEDPYFHYPLYFQTSYKGKLIWAINREHLQYLIDYLSADIRIPQSDDCTTMRSQSDILPAFMKSAKNREGIVKLLTKLRDNR